jgi:hypothetical protein
VHDFIWRAAIRILNNSLFPLSSSLGLRSLCLTKLDQSLADCRYFDELVATFLNADLHIGIFGDRKWLDLIGVFECADFSVICGAFITRKLRLSLSDQVFGATHHIRRHIFVKLNTDNLT